MKRRTRVLFLSGGVLDRFPVAERTKAMLSAARVSRRVAGNDRVGGWLGCGLVRGCSTRLTPGRARLLAVRSDTGLAARFHDVGNL